MKWSARATLGLALVGFVLGGGTLVAVHQGSSSAQGKRNAMPRLALVTSLPLLFGEQFSLESPQWPAIARIAEAYDVVPIAVADAASLRGFAHLLMAHPRAQPADVLVELDAWVRGGGHAVLLADPQLKWESSRKLGDPLRPPPDFADTGLLAHWGLRLGMDEAGEGGLRATSRDCMVTHGGLVARCRVGRGVARVIADADFMVGDGDEAERRLSLLMDQLLASDFR